MTEDHPSIARAIATARAFHIALFCGAGHYERRRAASLEDARLLARALERDTPGNFGRSAMIYIETCDGLSIHIE